MKFDMIKKIVCILLVCILLICILFLFLPLIEHKETKDNKVQINESKMEPQYVYNPEDVEAAQAQYDYVCSYVNAYGDKDYFYFNASDVIYSNTKGGICIIYKVQNSNIEVRTQNSSVYIGKATRMSICPDVIGTEFSIQKLEEENDEHDTGYLPNWYGQCFFIINNKITTINHV